MRQRVRRTAAATGILALMITLGTTGAADAGHPTGTGRDAGHLA